MVNSIIEKEIKYLNGLFELKKSPIFIQLRLKLLAHGKQTHSLSPDFRKTQTIFITVESKANCDEVFLLDKR